MKTLTSPGQIFFHKRVFPLIIGFAVGVVGLLVFWSWVPIYLATLIGLTAGALGALLARHQVSEYADEVIDHGDRIVVRNHGLEESIHLADIREADSTMMRPAGVWLHLRRDSVFGRSIKFLPNISLLGFSKLAKALNLRISQVAQVDAHQRR